LRHKKRGNNDETSNGQEMHEVWASAAHENYGSKSKAAPFFNSNTKKSGGLNDSTLIDGSIVNYECFLHEIDLGDLETDKLKI
jgi:hypothetical protein